MGSGQWIVGVLGIQKMYGLYGQKDQKVEISGDVTDAGRTTSREDRATQLLIWEMQWQPVTLNTSNDQRSKSPSNANGVRIMGS